MAENNYQEFVSQFLFFVTAQTVKTLFYVIRVNKKNCARGGLTMIYRKLGKTDLRVSAVGIGTEFLLKASQETTTEIVQRAVDSGINYFDVLFADPDYRNHFGEAFKGLRDQVIITGHLPVNDPLETCRSSFADHLKRLQIDAVDIVFVSCCDGEANYQSAMQPGGHYELAVEMVAKGRARFIGFSSHTVPVALQAVRSGKFNLLMFPINPAFDSLPGETGTDDLGNLWEKAYQGNRAEDSHGVIFERKQLYEECARQNIGLVAMKPFAAGWLFRPDMNTGFTPTNLLHYALSQTGVSCVVPGVSSFEQLEQDLAYFQASEAEKDFSAAVAQSRWDYQGTCMYCNHCQPCPTGIDISEVNRLRNLAKESSVESIQQAYLQLAKKASDCQSCGVCMERCPFNVDVIENMRQAVEIFEGVL
jgi:uncharacterized protein